MGRRIRVRAIVKEDPDIHLYVIALIALARQLQEEEERQAASQPLRDQATRREEVADDGS